MTRFVVQQCLLFIFLFHRLSRRILQCTYQNIIINCINFSAVTQLTQLLLEKHLIFNLEILISKNNMLV